jgi:hypothetical protein
MDYDFGQITILAINASNPLINETHLINVGFTGSLCEFGTRGHLAITDVEDDADLTWHPLDDVTVSVEVDNNYDDDEKVKVELELYDEDGKKIDVGLDTQSVKIDTDDSATFDFTFKVPADVDSGRFRLYAKAYLSTGGESEGCSDKWSGSYYEEVEIEKNDNDVAIDSEVLGQSMPFEVTCTQDVLFSIPVYNIGEEKEDNVKLILRNRELGISIEKSFENLRVGDNKNVDFEFTMPENATLNKIYSFDLLLYFDYSNGVYRNSNTYPIKFKVIGDTCKVKGDVVITAALDSQKVASGNEVKINTTLTNPGTTATTYSVSVDGIDGWATLKSVSPQTITLAPSEKKTVVITLQLDKSAAGDQTFAIKTSYNDQVKTQQVSMFVEKSSFFGKIFGESSWIANHWGLLLIILVNVALIVVIIVLAIKLSK